MCCFGYQSRLVETMDATGAVVSKAGQATGAVVNKAGAATAACR